MKNNLKIGLLFLLMIFLMGCQSQIVCNAPYILVGKDCCLDQNNNYICDTDEPSAEIKPAEQESPNDSLIEELNETVIPSNEVPIETKIKEETSITNEEMSRETGETLAQNVTPSLNWSSQRSNMKLTVHSIISERDKNSIFIKTISVSLQNLNYPRLTPRFHLYISDQMEPNLINADFGDVGTMFYTIDQYKVLSKGEETNFTLQVNEKIPRYEMKKTIKIEAYDIEHSSQLDRVVVQKNNIDLLNISTE